MLTHSYCLFYFKCTEASSLQNISYQPDMRKLFQSFHRVSRVVKDIGMYGECGSGSSAQARLPWSAILVFESRLNVANGFEVPQDSSLT